ncbi:MAG: hypothetical protein LJE57_04270 [Gallionella sp.]|nr:hypothetical protein [Gallionella sp.]
MAVLNNAPAALVFAERALKANQAGLGLCIGIDHGPVEVINGASGAELVGDGVVTASVMAAFATEEGLLATQNFRTALAHMSPGSESVLAQTENFSDAGLRTYQAFRLDRRAQRQRRRRFILSAVIAAALLIATAVTLRLGVPDRPRPLANYMGSSISSALDHLKRFSHGKP